LEKNMSNVDDIDLDVDLGDVEGGDGFVIDEGRYLMSITEMSVKDTKKGKCFMYTAEVLDTQDETKLKYAKRRARVYEIVNIDTDSAQMWRLKELLGGAFGIDSGRKIPASIKGKPFTAMVFVDDFNDDERNKLKNHKPARNWDGILYMMDDEELVKKDGGEKADAKALKSENKSSKGGKRDRAPASDEVEL
jgi:hypothetical protein